MLQLCSNNKIFKYNVDKQDIFIELIFWCRSTSSTQIKEKTIQVPGD